MTGYTPLEIVSMGPLSGEEKRRTGIRSEEIHEIRRITETAVIRLYTTVPGTAEEIRSSREDGEMPMPGDHLEGTHNSTRDLKSCCNCDDVTPLA